VFVGRAGGRRGGGKCILEMILCADKYSPDDNLIVCLRQKANYRWTTPLSCTECGVEANFYTFINSDQNGMELSF
jgi:hypothetical protein